MPIQPPSREELAQVASAFALHLTEEEIDAFYQLAEPTAAGYARLDELEDETLPVKYPPAETGYRRSSADPGLAQDLAFRNKAGNPRRSLASRW